MRTSLKSPARQAALLCLLALIPALFAGWLHPRRPDWQELRTRPPELSPARLRVLAGEAELLWVDARPRERFDAGHIPGALLLNEDHWEEQMPEFVRRWRPGLRVAVYCDQLQCGASRQVARRLREEFGVDTVVILEGGYAAWKGGQ